MASATSVSFTCPECAKVLRASARPAAGKKIKCPSCEHSFVPELNDDEDDQATRIQTKPGSRVTRVSGRKSRDEDDDDSPRNRKSRADEDDEDDKRSIKKKGKKKSSSMMLIVGGLVFVGGGALVSCVLCGVGAFVWPGFLMPAKNNEMLAFVAPDANVLVGGKPKELKTKFAGFKEIFNQAAKAGGGPNDQWPEMEDLILNSDQFLLFTNTTTKKMVGIVKAETNDIERLKKSNRLDAAKNVGGHSIHRIKQGPIAGAGPDLVAFSGGRFVVIGDVTENELVAALERSKKPPVKSAAIDLSRSVDKSPMWIAATFDPETRRALRDALNQGGATIPSMRTAAPTIDKAKGATFALDVTPKNDITLTASIMCKDGGDATTLKTGLEDGWKMVKGLLDAMAMLGGPAPAGPDAEAQKLIMRDLSSISFKTQGDTASANLTFTNQTIQEMAKLGQKNLFAGGPFGPGPIGPGPGPKKVPPFQPPPVIQPPVIKPPVIKPPPFQPPPVQPPGGKISTIAVTNLLAGLQEDRVINFQQGQRVTVTMTSTVSPKGGRTDVDLYVLQGNFGENILGSDTTIGPNGTVFFVAPMTGAYRVRVSNLGPGRVVRSTITINEQ